jgi:maltooligosyltrehalose trehalohydrolase
VRDFIAAGALDDPADPQTFRRCTLDFSERDTHRPAYLLHEDLLRMRRTVPAFSAQRHGAVDGAVLSAHAFVLRFFGATPEDDRLLVVNLGAELNRASFAEPLTAPPLETEWCVSWSSEDPKYAGSGTRDVWPDGTWSIPPESAIVCAPGPCRRHPGGIRRRTA